MSQTSIGIYNPYINTKGGGEKVTVALAEHLSKDYSVTLVSRESADLSEIGRYFNTDLSQVKFFIAKNKRGLFFRFFTTHRIPWPNRVRNLAYTRADYFSLKALGFDVFINNLYQSDIPCPSPHGIYMCMFPQELHPNVNGASLLKKIYSRIMDLMEHWLLVDRDKMINTYQLVAANSEFTKQWTRKRWHRESEVLYPICDTMGSGKTKEKIILNVGRFFADIGENHHKRQDFLLKTFILMQRAQKLGWELHFAGTAASDSDSRQYTDTLVKLAHGYPVFFHFNLSHDELRTLYQRASIYWHATGYGASAEKHPEKQEHFGITTVEAMSAGAVPVVIDSAGQRETVSNGNTGFLWNSQQELIERTESLLQDSGLCKRLGNAAINASTRYGKRAFTKRVDELMKRVLTSPVTPPQ